MTTATRLPSITRVKLHGGPAGDARHGVPEERGKDAEDEPDEGAGEHGVAAAARGHLDRVATRDDLASLHIPRDREQLLRLGLLGDHLCALLFCESDLVHEQKALDARVSAGVMNRSL